MAKVVTDDSHYKAIASAIRGRGFPEFKDETFDPSAMAEAINMTCDFEYIKGLEEGYTEEDIADAIEQGKQAEYDRFWDAFQQNGTLANYERVFAGRGWTAETFKPKYDIVPTACTQMFSASALPNCDLDELAANAGIKIDFSKAASFIETFNYTHLIAVGTIDTRSATGLQYIFSYSQKMQTIRLLILKDDGSQIFGNNSFMSCSALVNLTIQGVIGTTGANLQWSTKLSKASITSVVNALSSTTSGLSITLSKTAVNNAFTTAEWNALAGTKTNWTINLV